MTDLELAAAIDAYMERVKHPTLGELRRKLHTSTKRLERLRMSGLLKHPLPLPLSRSAASTLNRKRNKVGSGWYINRPAPWMEK